MQDSDDQNACGDPGFERSLLAPAAMARWHGLPVAWIEARPHVVQADLTTARTGLVMIDDGVTRADFRYGNKSMACEFTPGSIGLFTAGTELKLSRWRWNRTRRIYLDLEMALPGGADLLEPLHRLPLRTEIEFRDAELTSVLRMLAAEVAAGSPNGQLFAESLCLGIAVRLHQRSALRFSGGRERGRLTPAQVQAVEELVRMQLGGNIPLAELARAAGFSAPQFVRLFKNTMGCTPHQYVMAARLERAKELVLESQHSLSVIAELTGFANQAHMTGAFVRAFSTPPGEMRRTSRTASMAGK